MAVSATRIAAAGSPTAEEETTLARRPAAVSRAYGGTSFCEASRGDVRFSDATSRLHRHWYLQDTPMPDIFFHCSLCIGETEVEILLRLQKY